MKCKECPLCIKKTYFTLGFPSQRSAPLGAVRTAVSWDCEMFRAGNGPDAWPGTCGAGTEQSPVSLPRFADFPENIQFSLRRRLSYKVLFSVPAHLDELLFLLQFLAFLACLFRVVNVMNIEHTVYFEEITPLDVVKGIWRETGLMNDYRNTKLGHFSHDNVPLT